MEKDSGRWFLPTPKCSSALATTARQIRTCPGNVPARQTSAGSFDRHGRLDCGNFLHEIQKCPDLGRRMMAGVMVSIERITLLGPIGQYLHEFAALKPGAKSQLQTLEHALPRHTGSDRGRRVVRRESAASVDFNRLPLARKFPRERSTRLRIAKQQRLVMDQVVRC